MHATKPLLTLLRCRLLSPHLALQPPFGNFSLTHLRMLSFNPLLRFITHFLLRLSKSTMPTQDVAHALGDKFFEKTMKTESFESLVFFFPFVFFRFLIFLMSAFSSCPIPFISVLPLYRHFLHGLSAHMETRYNKQCDLTMPETLPDGWSPSLSTSRGMRTQRQQILTFPSKPAGWSLHAAMTFTKGSACTSNWLENPVSMSHLHIAVTVQDHAPCERTLIAIKAQRQGWRATMRCIHCFLACRLHVLQFQRRRVHSCLRLRCTTHGLHKLLWLSRQNQGWTVRKDSLFIEVFVISYMKLKLLDTSYFLFPNKYVLAHQTPQMSVLHVHHFAILYVDIL